MKIYKCIFFSIMAMLLLQACNLKISTGSNIVPHAPSNISITTSGADLSLSWDKGENKDSPTTYEIAIYNLTLHKKAESDFKLGTDGKNMDALKSVYNFTTEMMRTTTSGTILTISEISSVGFLPGNEYIFVIAAKKGAKRSDSTAVKTITIAGTNPILFNSTNSKHAIIKVQKTWDNAKKTAIFNGVSLVKIDNADEQEIIKNFIERETTASKTITTGIAPDGGGGKYLWIGATDVDTEGTWIWNGSKAASTALGTAVAASNRFTSWTLATGAYANWGEKDSSQTEPDNYNVGTNLKGQDHAGIAIEAYPNGAKYHWNDIAGSNTMSFIIEY